MTLENKRTVRNDGPQPAECQICRGAFDKLASDIRKCSLLSHFYLRCAAVDLSKLSSGIEHILCKAILYPEIYLMACLDSLKYALRHGTAAAEQPLSEEQYSTAFEIFMQPPGWTTYQDFIIPQLSHLMASLSETRSGISILEIGPGPKSVFGFLPLHLREKIVRYFAFEPNGLYADELGKWLGRASPESPMPNLGSLPVIHRSHFDLGGKHSDEDTKTNGSKFDIALFCHSMYSMKPKHEFIRKALARVSEEPQEGIVVIFHRNGLQPLHGLVCHRSATFPTGTVRVPDKDDDLDLFASFIAGNATLDEGVLVYRREVCRKLGRREEPGSHSLVFRSPEVMMAFTRHALMLPELLNSLPRTHVTRRIKNREAQSLYPAHVVRPTEIQHIQHCVRWALKHKTGLTVLGGGHSGHCIQSNVVSIDMSAFANIHVPIVGEKRDASADVGPLVFAEAGCQTGDIIRETMAVGLTIPLGARPSVGAGLWLQGGIGHLSRLYGLASDAIVGAVMVSVESHQVLCIGHVPSQHWPTNAVRPDDEADLLWAIKGAGTNFGIVVGLTFKASSAPTYLTQHWVLPLENKSEAQQKLRDFDVLVASRLPSTCSADAYLFWDTGRLHLAVTMIEASPSEVNCGTTSTQAEVLWGPGKDLRAVNGIELFDIDLYVSTLHGGHAGGKTSSFKRCVFLRQISRAHITDLLFAAVQSRPSPQCYLHLLHGGGAVGDIDSAATAFGCRDWDFACVITGNWPRDKDETELAHSTVQWVFEVAGGFLSVCRGVYSADLGPDPRDDILATKAFGANRLRLARLKRRLDPFGVLPYACPLPQLRAPKLILLVTGESCSGKDFCADVWMTTLGRHLRHNSRARVTSISECTKREYAVAAGADFSRLLHDRAYKESHRPALTAFFQEQERENPELSKEHFRNVAYEDADVDVLLITGMREEAPVGKMSHLVPGSRLIEINVQASEQTRHIRRGCTGEAANAGHGGHLVSDSTALTYHPGLVFSNDAIGHEDAERFAERNLVRFLDQDLHQLAECVRSTPNFPRKGIEFRHVLGISQQPGGLPLCTSLLQNHFAGDWSKVDSIGSCEAGGFIYASALAARVNVPMVIIREAGKLPPPTVSVTKSPSYVTSSTPVSSKETTIELERGAVRKGSRVVVVDDVLSTGETLCAVLRLLREAGVHSEDISIMVVAEFPIHCGRRLLCQRGFAKTNVQSLLIYGSE